MRTDLHMPLLRVHFRAFRPKYLVGPLQRSVTGSSRYEPQCDNPYKNS
jgi:hypothetical protein